MSWGLVKDFTLPCWEASHFSQGTSYTFLPLPENGLPTLGPPPCSGESGWGALGKGQMD